MRMGVVHSDIVGAHLRVRPPVIRMWDRRSGTCGVFVVLEPEHLIVEASLLVVGTQTKETAEDL